jgi:hypothetical protein
MECRNFLSLFKRLLQEWADKDKSLEMPLSAIPKSCCPPQEQETLVFDFDTVMKNFCSEIKVSRLSSVDGLYLDEQRNIIYLLEMKSVANYLKYQQKKKEPTSDEKSQSDEKFQSIVKLLFEGEEDLFKTDDLEKKKESRRKAKATLAKKAGDSYLLFFALFGYDTETGKHLIRCLLDERKFQIKYFIVVDMESKDYLNHRLAILNLLREKITHGFLKSSNIGLVDAQSLDDTLKNAL